MALPAMRLSNLEIFGARSSEVLITLSTCPWLRSSEPTLSLSSDWNFKSERQRCGPPQIDAADEVVE